MLDVAAWPALSCCCTVRTLSLSLATAEAMLPRIISCVSASEPCAQHGTALYVTAQRSTALYVTEQQSTAWRSTAATGALHAGTAARNHITLSTSHAAHHTQHITLSTSHSAHHTQHITSHSAQHTQHIALRPARHSAARSHHSNPDRRPAVQQPMDVLGRAQMTHTVNRDAPVVALNCMGRSSLVTSVQVSQQEQSHASVVQDTTTALSTGISVQPLCTPSRATSIASVMTRQE
jgi:hypothetical protein